MENKPSEKEGKYMETKTAKIERGADHTYLVLKVADPALKIELTSDNPGGIKAVFNQLVNLLKKGCFQFNLEDDSTDLFHHVCKEYLIQLNSEIVQVYGDMEAYQLLLESTDITS